VPKKKAKLPLSKTHPKLAKEADGWDPSSVTAGSGKKLNWKCSKGHKYNSAVYARSSGSKSGCPFCSGRMPIIGKTDLASTHPNIVKELIDFDPKTVTAGSSKMANWRCKNGHIWASRFSDRVLGGKGCAICANQKLLTGFNDLKSKFPLIAKEADGWDPKKQIFGSSKKFSWRCKNGHKWITTIAARTKNKSGCPVCKRKSVLKGVNDLKSTHPRIAKEAYEWDPTKILAGTDKKLGWKCKKGHIWYIRVASRTSKNSGCPYCANQKVLPGFNDLATIKPKIALQAAGWDPSKVSIGSSKKVKWKCIYGHLFIAPINARKSINSGCPICSNKIILAGFNDLATTDPDIAKESYGWEPVKYGRGSNLKMEWKCQKGHIYKTQIIKRTQRLNGCPYCSSHQVRKGFNDLVTTNPSVAKSAYGWDPSTVSQGSGKKQDWICSKGHITKSVVSQKKENQCPVCSHQKLLIGFNDLATTHPDIASSAFGWNPSTVISSSSKKSEWKCFRGHIWKATIAGRKNMNSGCPYCSNKLVLTGFNDLATTHPSLAKQAKGWDPTKVLAGNNKKAQWICESGHIWKSGIASRSTGVGCPTCSKSGFDPNQKGFLYFIMHTNWLMLQIGITNLPENRLKDHKKNGWTVIEIRGPMDGHLTQQWETAILRMLKAKGADLSNSKIAGKFDGYSEAWSKSTFPAKSIKELMRLTEEFEEGK
jgi:hypothetical protein